MTSLESKYGGGEIACAEGHGLIIARPKEIFLASGGVAGSAGGAKPH